MPARLDGRVTSFETFVAAVRDAGPMATVGVRKRAWTVPRPAVSKLRRPIA